MIVLLSGEMSSGLINSTVLPAVTINSSKSTPVVVHNQIIKNRWAEHHVDFDNF